MTDQLLLQDNALGADARWFVITNRSNVVDFLSSALIRPRVAMRKYYPDTLQLTEGAVPVVRRAASSELLALVGDRPLQFPVLVELRADMLSGTKDPRIARITVETIAAVIGIHLESEDDRQELTARTFANVAWDRVPIHVSPELFSGGDVRPEDIQSAVSAEGSEPTDHTKFSLEDRLGGARLLALHAAPRDPVRFESVARIVFDPPRRRRRGKAAVSEWMRLDETLAEYRPTKSAGYDERLYLAAAAVCIERSRSDAWDGARFLTEIDVLVANDGELRPQQLTRWRAAADRMRSILDARRPFERFTSSDFSAEQAILLAALRGEVDDVLAWRSEQIGGDWWNRTVAALLIGLVHGRTACSIALRPVELDLMLAKVERGRLAAGDAKGRHSRLQPVVTAVDSEGMSWLVLEVSGTSVLRVPQEAPSTIELVRRLDFEDNTVMSRLLTIAAERGWDEAMTTTVRIAGAFETRPAARGAVIEFQGAPEFSTELDRVAFMRRVEAEDGDDLRESVRRLRINTPPAAGSTEMTSPDASGEEDR